MNSWDKMFKAFTKTAKKVSKTAKAKAPAQKKKKKKPDKKPFEELKKSTEQSSAYGGLTRMVGETNKRKAAENRKKQQDKLASVRKAYEKGKSVSALGTKIEEKTYKTGAKKGDNIPKKAKYKNLTMEEYIKLQAVARTGASKDVQNKMLGKELAKKVGALNVKDYAKGSFGMGLLEGSNPLPVELDKIGAGEYTKTQKGIIEKGKSKGSYTAGYVGGQIAQFGLGGVPTLGRGIASGALKGAAKRSVAKGLKEASGEAVESMAKGVIKDQGRFIGKRADEAIKGMSKGKKFAADRLGDVAASSPLNLVDAIKSGTDSEGKTDPKLVAKHMGINTALDVGVGGALEGVGMLFTRANGKKLITLQEKVNAGKATPEDKKELIQLYDKLERASEDITLAKSNVAEDYTAKGKGLQDKALKESQAKAIDELKVNIDNAKIRLSEAKSADKAGIIRRQIKSLESDLEELTNGTAIVRDGKIRYGVEPKKIGIEETPRVDTPGGTKVPEAKAQVPEATKTPKAKETPTAENIADVEVKADKAKTKWQESRDFDDLREWAKAERGKASLVGKVTAKAENPKAKAYEELPTVERIKEKSPDAAEVLKRAKAGEISGAEISEHAYKLADSGYFNTEELIDGFIRGAKNGDFDKVNGVTHEEALINAQNKLDSIGTEHMYHQVMGQKVYNKDSVETAAERAVLMVKLSDDAVAGKDTTEMLLRLAERDVEIASEKGRGLNAAKLILRTTPQGRVRMMINEVNRLTREHADVLKGKKLELTDEQANRILNAKTDDEIGKAMNDTLVEIYNDIPVTLFQKFNAIRHFSMLANFKTHERNILGNGVFWGARGFSDFMEINAYKIPAIQKKMDSFKANPANAKMLRVTREEMKSTREYLDKVFDENYPKSGSSTRWKEGISRRRPEDAKIFQSKIMQPMDKLVKANYKLLDVEDMICFKPEYRKSYIRWCKTHDIPLEKISEMTESQKKMANDWAMKKAEYATYRDDSSLSRAIVRLKDKTATKTGSTPPATALYRAGNVAVESVLPFVKTPVNILRRSVDFSPLGLARGSAKLGMAKNVDTFMQGVHDICTGLTGTGVMAIGMWIASKDWITVEAKDETGGDEFYGRELGFQDYSIKFHFGDKLDYSASADWVAPMQVSFFTGAALYRDLEEKGLEFHEMFNLFKVASKVKGDEVLDLGKNAINPLLDMSFMQSSKDTIEMFMEHVYKRGTGEDADWTGAIKKTLFGSLPQGYFGGFVPQLSSQTAQFADKYQRDTRSTKEGTLGYWESWARKMANKVPVLRQAVLNPKVDRFGREVVTIGGDDLFAKAVHAFLNPATTKRITLNDTDRELIKIYRKMPDDSEDKKFFFYNLTGNPPYDLHDGKRMSYDELYKYGKTKRKTQYGYYKGMFKAGSYKNMTNAMKAEEVGKYHRISSTAAGLKTYGSEYAVKGITKGKSTRAGAEASAWKKHQHFGGDAKSFVDGYIWKEKVCARAQNTDYYTKAIALAAYEVESKKKGKAAQEQAQMLQKAYGVYGDKLDTALKYIAHNGNDATKAVTKFTDAYCNCIGTVTKSNVSNNKMSRSRAAAEHKIDEQTYYAMGYDWSSAQAGGGLKKYGYTLKQLENMEADILLRFDADNSNSLNKSEVIAYVQSLGLKSKDKAACVFQYFSTAKNPFATIADHLKWGSTPPESSGRGGRGRRGWGRGRRGGGGSARGDWDTYVKGIFGDSLKASGGSGGTGSKRVSDYTFDSPLDAAYRKALKKRYKS